MNKYHTTPDTYNTLAEIKLRKAMLLKDIQKDDDRIHNLWTSLFRRPTALKRNASPSKRINSLMATGVGFFDAIMLAWKLYKKFKR
jgi:hypothetical protein